MLRRAASEGGTLGGGRRGGHRGVPGGGGGTGSGGDDLEIILECSFSGGAWELVRPRLDKKKPNSASTADECMVVSKRRGEYKNKKKCLKCLDVLVIAVER